MFVPFLHYLTAQLAFGCGCVPNFIIEQKLTSWVELFMLLIKAGANQSSGDNQPAGRKKKQKNRQKAKPQDARLLH